MMESMAYLAIHLNKTKNIELTISHEKYRSGTSNIIHLTTISTQCMLHNEGEKTEAQRCEVRIRNIWLTSKYFPDICMILNVNYYHFS